MTEVSLNVRSTHGTEIIPARLSRVTVGRGEDATIRINDPGLSLLHASINVDGGRVWILDEQSVGGSFVNGNRVPAHGHALRDGDEIVIGDDTVILVNLLSSSPKAGSQLASGDSKRAMPLRVPLTVAAAM